MCVHEYETIKETPSGFRDRCKRCGKVTSYARTAQGTVDERKYAREHARDFLQSRDPKTAKAFEREYGKPVPLPTTSGPTYEEVLEEAKEELRSMSRTVHGPTPRRC